MTDMNGNLQCEYCSKRGERGLDVILYRVDRGRTHRLCDDCAVVWEEDGRQLDRLADQSGKATMEAA